MKTASRAGTILLILALAAGGAALPAGADDPPADPGPPGPVPTPPPLPGLPDLPGAPDLPGLPGEPDEPPLVGELEDLLTYEIRTVYHPEGDAPVVVSTPALLFVPTPVNVDEDLTTGVGGQDLVVQLAIDGARPSLRVVALPGAPDPLPVVVEAILSDPRQESPLRVAFGYDATADTAPLLYTATLTLVGAPRVTSFSLELTTLAAGETLGVTAEIYTEGPDGERLRPQRGRIDYTPVPTAAHFGVLAGSDFGIQQSGVDLVTDTPTRVEVVVEDVRGADRTLVEAVIDRLPHTLTLILTDTGQQSATWTYSASARVDQIGVRMRELAGAAILDELDIVIEDMPTAVQIVQHSAERVTLDASGAIGVLRVGFASGGAARYLADPAYVYADDRGGVDSIAFQVLGLTSAEVVTGDPFVIAATLQAGPFRVLVHAGSLTVDARIEDLPRQFRIEASTGGGTVDYTGSDPIGRLTIDATDPSGITGRATELHLLLEGIPTSLQLSFAEDAGEVGLRAGDGVLGLIEVQLTSGPDRRLPAEVDGILVEDLASHYAVFGRVTGLREVSAILDPPEILFRTLGGRVFVLDLNQQSGGGAEYVRATFDHLVEEVRVRLVEAGGRQEIRYEASAPTNSLTFETNTGDRWRLEASIADPLPASLVICAASGGACTGGTRSAGAGSFSFRASEHTTINLFDCVRPANASCPGGPVEYLHIDNLRIRLLEVDADTQASGLSGYLYMNTTDHTPGCQPAPCRFTLSGEVTMITSGGDFGLNFRPTPGFWADDRLVEWVLFFTSKSGAVNCPSGTQFRVRVFGIWIGLTGFLC